MLIKVILNRLVINETLSNQPPSLKMSTQLCGKCQKTVYPTEKIEAADKHFHKSCFKCIEQGCNISLTLKTLNVVDGALYCIKHVPKQKVISVADSLSVTHALNAPKKADESRRLVNGSGEKINVGLDSISLQHAQNAPKKSNENLGYVQKGQ